MEEERKVGLKIKKPRFQYKLDAGQGSRPMLTDLDDLDVVGAPGSFHLHHFTGFVT
jgi:hypothetical protein